MVSALRRVAGSALVLALAGTCYVAISADAQPVSRATQVAKSTSGTQPSKLITQQAGAAKADAAPATTKIMVDRSAAGAFAGSAFAASATLIRDYGAFAVYSLPATLADGAAKIDGVTHRPDYDTISLRRGVIDTRLGARPAQACVNALAKAHRAGFVQFSGPIQPDDLARLTATGAQIVHYVPQNAYIVWTNDDQSRAAVGELTGPGKLLQFTDDFRQDDVISPALDSAIAAGAGEVSVTVQVFNFKPAAGAPSSDATVATVISKATRIIRPSEKVLDDTYTNITLSLPANAVGALASLDGVVNVEPYFEPHIMRSERQDMAMAGVLNAGGTAPSGAGYLAWLAGRGFPTDPSQYPITCIVDDGVDNGTATPADPAFYVNGVISGNPSRLLFNNNATSDANAFGPGGHAHINTSIVGGYDVGLGPLDANLYLRGMGVSPYTRLGAYKIFTTGGGFSLSKVGGTDAGLANATYAAGARISSNSWGANTAGSYDSECQAYDRATRDAQSGTAGNQQLTFVFAAGNAGPGGVTVGTPGGAKNVITVGATEDTDASGTDGCGTSASGADNIQQIIGFSSRGPCADGRVKPDIVAPGTHVAGKANPSPSYNGGSVCDKYWPSAGQTVYARSSGTSHSTPAVAGFASLTSNYLTRVYGFVNPSPALIKAYILHSARYLAATGGNLPSNNQGFGFTNGDLAFKNTVPRAIRDQSVIFTTTGDSRTINGNVASLSEPVRVALVWTDAAGTSSGAAWVNDLNLTVTVGGNTYKGNVFTGGTSVTGGTADTKNNAECVFLPAGTAGAISVTVTAANIAGVGVPGSGISQDYALVIYNISESGVALGGTGVVTMADSTGNGNNNGKVDPGESDLAVSVQINNLGISTATNVSATLTTDTPTVTITHATEPYPNLATNATATNTTPYRFSVSPSHACGDPVNFVLNITSDQGSGTYAFSFTTGTQPSPNAPATFSYTGPRVAIPDGTFDGPGAPANVTIPVSIASGTIYNLQFRIDGSSCSTAVGAPGVGLDHSFVGDLTMTLTSPSGTTLVLAQNPGGSGNGGNNFCNTVFSDAGATSIVSISSANAPWSNTYKPNNPLGIFIGENPNGNWTFSVTDATEGDTGGIRAVSLIVTTIGGLVCTPPGVPITCKPSVVTGTGCMSGVELLSYLNLYFTNYDGFGSGVPASATLPPPFAAGPIYAVPCTPNANPPVVPADGLKGDYDGDCQLTPTDLLGFLSDYFNPNSSCFSGC